MTGSTVEPLVSSDDTNWGMETSVDGYRLVTGVEDGPQFQRGSWLESVLIVDSTKSGRGCSQIGDSVLIPLFKALKINYTHVSTTSASTITDAAAALTSSRTVIVIGGDTSVHEFVNGLKETGNHELRLVVIPTGTGNALANSVGHTSPAKAVSRFLSVGEFKPLASFEIDFPNEKPIWALVVASWGLHSAIVADSDTPELRKHGIDRFKLAAQRNIHERKQQYFGRIVTKDRVEGSDHSYLLFSLVHSLEPGFKISPNSHPPSDTTIWTVRIPTLDHNGDLLEIMREVYANGSHVQDNRVSYFPLKSTAKIEVMPQPAIMRRWCVDGRIILSEPGTVVLHTASTVVKNWNLRLCV